MLPESAPWINDFLDETATFPSGVHDDCVDSMTQALNYLREQASHFNSFALFTEINAPRKLDKEGLWEKAMLGLSDDRGRNKSNVSHDPDSAPRPIPAVYR